MNSVGQHLAYGSSTLIIVSGKKQEGMEGSVPYCNASCVMENMMLASTELGLGSVYLLAVLILMQFNTEFQFL